jgi:hypothetical protein
MGLADITLQSIAFRTLALLLLASVQGGILAAVAVSLGDKGPKYDGRLTLVPASHIDLVGAAGLVLFGLGWAKPVAIDAQLFRIGRWGIVVVILAGFVGLLGVAVLLQALILPALTMLPYTAGLTTSAFLRAASDLSIWFALLALVPIPPLTAGLLWPLFGLRIPQKAQWILPTLLFVAVAVGVVRLLLTPAHTFLASVLFAS